LAAVIKKAVSDLKIPYQFRESARQEGYLAYCENRDVAEALRYWWEKEQLYRRI